MSCLRYCITYFITTKHIHSDFCGGIGVHWCECKGPRKILLALIKASFMRRRGFFFTQAGAGQSTSTTVMRLKQMCCEQELQLLLASLLAWPLLVLVHALVAQFPRAASACSSSQCSGEAIMRNRGPWNR